MEFNIRCFMSCPSNQTVETSYSTPTPPLLLKFQITMAREADFSLFNHKSMDHRLARVHDVLRTVHQNFSLPNQTAKPGLTYHSCPGQSM